MRDFLRAITLSLWLALVGGCASGSGRGSGRHVSSRHAIDEIHLFGIPVTLDLDSKPGPDGFGIRIYANNKGRAKGIPIQDGSLEILMFDGIPPIPDTTSQKPRRTWTFTAAELKAFLSKTAIGTGYRFALRWDDAAPARDRITIIARYTSPHGAPIFSGPSTISVLAK